MRTVEVEANLVRLNEIFRHPAIPELIERKLTGAERSALSDADLAFHENEYRRLVRELEEAGRQSQLPDAASVRPALNDLLVRLRLGRTRR